MPYLKFVAKHRDPAYYNLRGASVVMGRSLDCDIFLPDAFVSRQHCRFERTEEGWVVTDLGSTNGIYHNGQRIGQRLLQRDDLFEVGTVAIVFEDEDIAPKASTPTPFGEAGATTELVDTLFAHDVRPADYLRQQKRKPAWRRPKPVLEPEFEVIPLDTGMMPEPLPEPDEWTELDVEVQIERVCATLPDPPPIQPYTPPPPGVEYVLGATPQLAGVPKFEMESVAPLMQVDEQEEQTLERPRARQVRKPKPTAPQVKFGPTLGDRLRDAVSGVVNVIKAMRRIDMTDMVDAIRAHPLAIASTIVLAIAIFFGYRWTTGRMSQPPQLLSDGSANPDYFNGDEPG